MKHFILWLLTGLVAGVLGFTVLPSLGLAELTVIDPAAQLEQNVNRAGGDYRNIDLGWSTDPKACMKACLADGRCKSFTFVRPGSQGPRARCWLKNTIPVPVASNCCVSGVKGGLEPHIDRPGADIANLVQATGGAPGCRARCLAREGCRAFTFVKAGVHGPQPRCFLKNRVPAARPATCCTSGALR